MAQIYHVVMMWYDQPITIARLLEIPSYLAPCMHASHFLLVIDIHHHLSTIMLVESDKGASKHYPIELM